MKVKQSNLNLLRIFAMIFIVFHNAIIKGNITQNCSNDFLKFTFTFLDSMLCINFNVLIIIEGYNGIKKNNISKKIWKIINASLFYKITIMITLLILGIMHLNLKAILKEILPLDIDDYWFIKYYVFLLCLTPFLNNFLKKMKKSNYQKMILIMTIIFSIIPYITGSKAFENNGYTLYNFIYLYIVGSYLRLHNVRYNYIFEKCSDELYKIFLKLIFVGSIIINFSVYIMSSNLKTIGPIFKDVFQNIENMSMMFSNPFIILESICLVLIFLSYDIKSRVINYLSSLIIGIYLIHDNPFISKYIYKWLKIDNRKLSFNHIPELLAAIVVIFVSCMIIEAIRKLVFYFIYNRKFANNIRNRYYKHINNIKFITKRKGKSEAQS